MQPRPSFDRALLMLIAIGVISILGIGWFLLVTNRGESPIHPTAIPSSFSSLEAETVTPTPSTTPTATRTSPTTYSPPPAETLSSTSTLIAVNLPTSSATPAPDESQSLRAGKYDDTDPNITYDPYWTALKNPGTENAYQRTIHASTGIGNQASFHFIGKQIHLGYQRGKNFGTVTVLIDDEPYSFHEQDFSLVWYSPQLPPGDHFVQIIHESGESINLDYIVILD